jgi:lysophospholipase L1-like esterase
MACRIATTHAARALGAGLLAALICGAPARAQTPAAGQPASNPAFSLSKSCQVGSPALAAESPLPNVAAALAKRKTLRILVFGAAPGRTGAGGAYTDVIESMLEGALKGTNVVVINRGVSGELAANAAARMKNEVALEEPDLVLWQVGTNDALAYVPEAEFVQTVEDQIAWLRAHKVDVVLVGLQFAPQMLRNAHYVEIREALRRLAAQENVVVIRFYEAMQMLNEAANDASAPITEQFERGEAGYDCLAQYVARAVTLSVFARNLPKRPAGK